MQRRLFTSKLEIFRKIEIAPRPDSRNVNESDEQEKERGREWKRLSHGVIKTLKVSKSLQTPRNLQKPSFLPSFLLSIARRTNCRLSDRVLSWYLLRYRSLTIFLCRSLVVFSNDYNLGYPTAIILLLFFLRARLFAPSFNSCEPFDDAVLSSSVKVGDRPCMHFGRFPWSKKKYKLRPHTERGAEEGQVHHRRNVLRDGSWRGDKLCRCGVDGGGPGVSF